ncbi:ATP-binding protein [Pelobacter seleniigenes]|uniref:ATP-binding protein n=1 Tax=Pelobacter seleniigenes TaxID=407188 RepID=UPI0004A74262|nr:ATP-binding protein [Pelobacter seleniigenes]
MKPSITYRLFGAILLAAGLAVVSMVLIAQWNLDRGFLKFVRDTEAIGVASLSETLLEYYAENQSWQPLQHNGYLWRDLIRESLPRDMGPPPDFMLSVKPMGARPSEPSAEPKQKPQPSPDMKSRSIGQPQPPGASGGELPPLPFIKNYNQRFFLFDSQMNLLIGAPKESAQTELTPLQVDQQVVGYLGFTPTTRLTDNRHLLFLHSQKMTVITVSIIIVLLSAGLSLLLASRLVRPLKHLAETTHKLTGGEFSSRVPVTSNDELGRLAADFNTLALTLEKNEQARRQWVADISHELRTPIGILRGEIEALLDGVRKADTKALESLHAESLRLGRLVSDLYQLSMSDLGALTYRKTRIDGIEVLKEVVDSYLGEIENHQLHFFGVAAPSRPVEIFGDPERLHQLFSNLLDNSLKYTEAGGYLKIVASKGKEVLEINFQDSAPSVATENLDRLFDRLFRVESSRNRATGGAGLGLTICRNIVEAHQGSIAALKSPLGGLWIKVTLPLPGVTDAG